MILQLITESKVRALRKHVIQRLRHFAADLEADKPKAVEKAEEMDVSAQDLRAAADQLQAEAGAEAAMQEAGGPSHEQAYIPSSRLTCMLQSLLEEVAEQRGFIEQASDTQRLAAGTVALTSSRLKEDKIDVLGLNGDAGIQGLAVGDMREGEDIRYFIDGALGVAVRLLAGRHPFNSRPAKLADLGSEARIVLFGDWASGLDRAQDLAKIMGGLVRDGARGSPQRKYHLVHLGDTYYTGRRWEYERRFLPNWPDTGGHAATQWSLNGNHDMYAGGNGYFETLLQNDLFKSHRADPGEPATASSFFLLQNDHWQIFGLDSSYDSPELTGMNGALNEPQVKFMKEKLDPKKRVLLLTHHQLFSARKGEGNSSVVKKDLQEAGLWKYITAWIWGHEHRCVLYEQKWTQEFHGLDFAMCMGNSGIPVKDEPIEKLDGVEWEYTESFPFTIGKRLRHFAFACLDFDPATPEKMKVIIHNWKGLPVKEVTI